MTSFDGSSADDFSDSINLLPAEEGLDDQEVGEDLDEGYSPAERPLALFAWGTTAAEASSHESLGRRLSREEPDIDGADKDGDGLGDATDTDGELIDDQVGDHRAGRLLLAGVDGAGASAEEAAIHVVPDDESGY